MFSSASNHTCNPFYPKQVYSLGSVSFHFIDHHRCPSLNFLQLYYFLSEVWWPDPHIIIQGQQELCPLKGKYIVFCFWFLKYPSFLFDDDLELGKTDAHRVKKRQAVWWLDGDATTELHYRRHHKTAQLGKVSFTQDLTSPGASKTNKNNNCLSFI